MARVQACGGCDAPAQLTFWAAAANDDGGLHAPAGLQECGCAAPEDSHLLRLLTPLAKLFTAKEAVAVVSEGEPAGALAALVAQPPAGTSLRRLLCQAAASRTALPPAPPDGAPPREPSSLLAALGYPFLQASSSLVVKVILRAPTCR